MLIFTKLHLQDQPRYGDTGHIGASHHDKGTVDHGIFQDLEMVFQKEMVKLTDLGV